MPGRIEVAENEFDRWRQRELRLVEVIRAIDQERRRLELELEKVVQQVTYYDSLTRDMQRELGTPSLSSLLSSLRKT